MKCYIPKRFICLVEKRPIMNSVIHINIGCKPYAIGTKQRKPEFFDTSILLDLGFEPGSICFRQTWFRISLGATRSKQLNTYLDILFIFYKTHASHL